MNFTEINRTLRIIVLVCIPYFIWAIINSNYVMVFLHPRSVSLLKTSGIALAILALYNVRSFFKIGTTSRFDWKTAVILLPFLFGIVVHPTGFSARQVMQKGLSVLPGQQNATLQKDTSPTALYDSLISNIPNTTETFLNRDDVKSSNDTLQHVKSKEQVIRVNVSAPHSAIVYDTINDNEIFEKLDRCYGNPQVCVDKAVVMTGFIVPDTILGRHSFLLARMLVSCCAADAVPAGIYCLTDTLLGFKESEWVQISGIIQTHSIKQPWDNEEHIVPVLMVTRADKTERPKIQYIYPYNY